MNAVSGSGIASMSDPSMLSHARMLEPSKPRPSSNTSSVSSLIGQLKCCQVPKVSTNLMSTIFAAAFLAISSTLFGVLIISVLFCLQFNSRPETRRGKISDGLLARLFSANANRVLDRAHKNLSVPDLAGLRRLHDRLHRRVDARVRQHHFDFQLG